MALTRDRPYLASHFAVSLVAGNGRRIELGFSEVVFPEFRAEPADAEVPDGGEHLVLRRASCGDLVLYDWWQQARRGKAPQRRTVQVDLLTEDHAAVAMRWRFRDARPVALGYSPLRANESALLIETITVAFGVLEMD